MQFKGMSRSHLFLIELIIVVLFFSFAGAVTVQVFSKARIMSDDATALNGAVLAVQTAAEADKGLRLQEIDPDGNTVYFDGTWKITDSSQAVYTMTSEVVLEQREAGTMAVYHYEVKSEDEIIWQLQSKKYYSGKLPNETSLVEVN